MQTSLKISAADMAATHRERFYSMFDLEGADNAIVVMRGGSVEHRYDTDFELPFRQESRFWYLTGVSEPDYSAIFVPKTGECHLFAPKREASYAVWNGRIRSQEDIQALYKPDALHYSDAMQSVIDELAPDRIFTGAEGDLAALGVGAPEGCEIDHRSVIDILTLCRLYKTEGELERLRFANKANCDAHHAVLRSVRPDAWEYQMKGVLEGTLMQRGLQFPAYNGIYASGTNSAILHYVVNNQQMGDGELFLIDSGYEFEGYGADLTRTWPVNGVFSDVQREMYSIVLEMQKRTIAATRPGVKMEDLHFLACRTLLEGLLEGGYVKGSVEDLMAQNIFALFFPHGLGHFLGLDVHDPGGYPKGVDRIDRPGVRFLRSRRELESGMVITIEPGFYMIPALLGPAFDDPTQSSFLNRSKLEPLLDFGGIRIEDNLVLNDSDMGHENMTSLVKEIDEIEAIMKDAKGVRG
ncbi:MAG: aminopeptidase P family protein [Balneolaceae bacterium]|nr:aminopeptidase P family protein [Balneolaceae bacterium]